MVHRAPLLVLNRPFDGIDPFSTAIIRSLLRRYTASGTVVYTR